MIKKKLLMQSISNLHNSFLISLCMVLNQHPNKTKSRQNQEENDLSKIINKYQFVIYKKIDEILIIYKIKLIIFMS
jgi:hypothetical protein